MRTLLLAEIRGHVSIIKSGRKSLIACGTKRELSTDQLVHNKMTPCLPFARSKNEKGWSLHFGCVTRESGWNNLIRCKRVLVI
jgi:hypothetical protein